MSNRQPEQIISIVEETNQAQYRWSKQLVIISLLISFPSFNLDRFELNQGVDTTISYNLNHW